MKLATTTGDFWYYTRYQPKSLECIREAGFKYADYSFGHELTNRNGVYADNYEEYFNEVIEASEKYGVKLIQAHSPLGAPIAKDNEQFLADTIRSVDACGAWGIKNLVVHSGYEKGLTVKETFARNREFYMPILERAEKYGVNILVENFNKMSVEGLYWIDNAPDLLEFVEYMNHPLCHVLWDVGHANMQDMPQDEALRMLGSHVRGLHVHDNKADNDTHLMPYKGTLNLDAVMNGLFDIGYEGYFTFEVGGSFVTADKRRKYERDTRLATAPLSLRIARDKYMYELGKTVLSAYGCYEE